MRPTSPGFLDLLDRLIAVSRHRHPAACDVARDVRYRAFDRPTFDEVRRTVYATMEAHLATLARDPYGAGRRARIDALVECPQPLKELFAPRFESASPVVREVMLEVLTRRFYRIRQLGPFTGLEAGERSVVLTEYTLGRPSRSRRRRPCRGPRPSQGAGDDRSASRCRSRSSTRW